MHTANRQSSLRIGRSTHPGLVRRPDVHTLAQSHGDATSRREWDPPAQDRAADRDRSQSAPDYAEMLKRLNVRISFLRDGNAVPRDGISRSSAISGSPGVDASETDWSA